MRFIFPAILASTVILAGCASDSQSAGTNEPGLLGRMWESTQKLNPLGSDMSPREPKQRTNVNLKSLAMELTVDPVAPKLSEQRQVTATIRLTNRGKKLVQLDFPTTQRVEAVIQDKSGSTIERWSEDERFEREPGMLAINPGERVEYRLNLATREMTPGGVYTVEAFFPSYNALRGTATVTPVK
jgi:hypothetical protein